ncbi:MAG: pseudouridine synthase [Clostridia bacterium]|nr:pseudouridine synthase [Clostridia bacterium]
MLIRLHKYLAEAQVASRRKAEEIILQGRVKVNGKTIAELGTRVESDSDVVTVDGKRVQICEKMIYIMLNKPEGCVTTVKDQFDRKSVLDYVSDVKERVYPVGRLDYDTSGLLILTNDGDLTYKLTHPKHNIEKTYIADVDREPDSSDMERFKNGLIIDGRKTAPAEIEVIKKGRLTSLKIKIHEGRNRQVRKMCSAINCNVVRLKRIAEGNLELGRLEKGKYRYLTAEEIVYIKGL